MNHTKKRKLKRRLKESESILKYYEILENIIKNGFEGKTPKLISWERDDLIQWLEENKERHEQVKVEFERLKERLKDLEL